MSVVARALGTAIVGLWKTILYVIFGTVAVLLVFTLTTAVHVWGFARSDDRSPADTILVLGAAQYDGRPSAWFAARLDHAARLYQQGVASRIVTVGGKALGDRYTEAEAGKNYLSGKYNIPDTAIVDIDQGRDTLTSAVAFKQRAGEQGWDSTVVVTDPGHSLRATRMVQDQGLEAWSSPTRQGPSVSTRKVQANTILHETGGLVFYTVYEREQMNEQLAQAQGRRE